VHTARTDDRIKAVGTVVPSKAGPWFRSVQPDGPVAEFHHLADGGLEGEPCG
jgi:hypothetical protein